MTAQKHLKQLVRTRMKKTGESYATARRHVVRQAPAISSSSRVPSHFAGIVPATTALRILLTQAGVCAPHTGKPFSEAMLFGIAGGIGAGVFSFAYEKEDTASFFIAGRHGWQDDLTYLRAACQRLGISPTVQESSGARAAEKQLRTILDEHGVCIAWVDMAHLPHRALPSSWSGGGYHVITVYSVDDQSKSAQIGDLTDEPITIPLEDLARARERIKKQKHRLLAIPKSASPKELAPLVKAGLQACHEGLAKQRMQNFRLDAFRVWGERMHASKDKESWERVFPPGHRLWNGLVSIYSFIEHYGTGGGLCRPIFADFLAEASEAIGDPRLKKLSAGYAELGKLWTELAHAALPEEVPAFREARDLHSRKAELTSAGGPVEEIRQIWERLAALEQEARREFPLDAGASAELRAGLQARILAAYESEVAAHTELGDLLS